MVWAASVAAGEHRDGGRYARLRRRRGVRRPEEGDGTSARVQVLRRLVRGPVSRSLPPHLGSARVASSAPGKASILTSEPTALFMAQEAVRRSVSGRRRGGTVHLDFGGELGYLLAPLGVAGERRRVVGAYDDGTWGRVERSCESGGGGNRVVPGPVVGLALYSVLVFAGRGRAGLDSGAVRAFEPIVLDPVDVAHVGEHAGRSKAQLFGAGRICLVAPGMCF